ncbi:MAG: helix-turn-helix transcriptional regulator [Neisseriaceae bacterium]|nr:helix-turn-helix transcriptional regulator [Neisseriaceae bacterium]
MEKKTATLIFESLASGVRLDVFKCLLRKGPDGMVAGEIALALDIPASNLSFHLKDLLQKNLITVEQEGRFLRYRANITVMNDLIGFLKAECCIDSPRKFC